MALVDLRVEPVVSEQAFTLHPIPGQTTACVARAEYQIFEMLSFLGIDADQLFYGLPEA